MEEPKLLKVEAAAKLLSIGRSKAYALLASGQLPSVRVGASVRVPRRALEEWIEARTVGGITVAAIVGHRSLEQTARYTRLLPRVSKDAARRIGEALG